MELPLSGGLGKHVYAALEMHIAQDLASCAFKQSYPTFVIPSFCFNLLQQYSSMSLK